MEIYEYDYDFSGRKTKFRHSKNGIQKTIASYTYDATGRMTQKLLSPSSAIGSSQTGNWPNTGTWQGGSIPTISDQVTINSGHIVTIPSGQTVSAGTLFDKGILQNFGTLQMGTLAPSSGSGTLQTVDYQYHIRGNSLRGINLDAAGNLTNKIFSLKLGYEDAGFYDGNIGKQEFRNSLDNITRSFTYSYDGASRITGGSYVGNGSENYSLNSVSYDLNGNIKTLSRNGYKSNNTFGLIDNLNYTYNANSNKIQAVTDNSGETASFTDATGETDYTYSLDGSLISDANKGISVIEYNYLKLPRRIVKGGVNILYQYDASGKKLKETIGSQVTDYVGNKIYKNNVLYQLGHDEGRIVNEIYEYQIKDHLGNLRVAFKDSLGIAKIVQANSYGIWGEDLTTLSYKNTPNIENHRFTGKENLPETGYTDFGARFYDNLVPRFITIDPLAEKLPFSSTYTYGLNNPIKYIDSDGAFPYPVTIRAFAPIGSFKGTGFHDDGRSYSTRSDVTSRISQTYTIDPSARRITGGSPTSSPTILGSLSMTATDEGGINASFSKTSLGNTAKIDGSFEGSNPFFLGLAPDIEVSSNITLTENLEKGTLGVSVNLSSKQFPATEANIQDSKKQTIFLGGAAAYGNPADLVTANKSTVKSLNLTINIDKKGVFQNVTLGKKTYSIAEFNKTFTPDSAGPYSRENKDK